MMSSSLVLQPNDRSPEAPRCWTETAASGNNFHLPHSPLSYRYRAFKMVGRKTFPSPSACVE